MFSIQFLLVQWRTTENLLNLTRLNMRYACQYVLYIYFPFIGKVIFFYMFFLHKNILAIEAEKKENKIHTHT
uniref:Uncharacterized protein n=1 Tax=Nelumbo nucifera TaxID=4432 RepID=A0A822ZL14_NELNU|nr:TPA_asm: hypothetical protein HUJ06_004102 [Nelumbo nucifera]